MLALKYFYNRKTKFVKNSKLFDQYKERINDCVDNGLARVVPKDYSPESDDIPHHAVATKAKNLVVFNCAAAFRGTSLNQNL